MNDGVGLDQARAAKERAKAVFARTAALVGVGITRINGGYGVKVNLESPPRRAPTSPRSSMGCRFASRSSGPFASSVRLIPFFRAFLCERPRDQSESAIVLISLGQLQSSGRRPGLDRGQGACQTQ